MAEETTYVKPGDVLARWLPVGSAPVNSEEQLAVILSDLEDYARSRIPDFDTRATSQELRPATLRRVLSTAVIRVWKTAYDPRSSYSEGVGPYSSSGTFRDAGAQGVTLTEEEIQELTKPREDDVGKAFTVPLLSSSHSALPIVWEEVRGAA